MFKIEFLGSAAEVRQEMFTLLGLSGTVSLSFAEPSQELSTNDTPNASISESGDSFGECSTGETKQPRKRRTKAQIEADERAALAEKAAPAADNAAEVAETEEKEDEPPTEELKEVKPPAVEDSEEITVKMVRMACVNAQDRLRNGEPVLAVLEKYNAKSCADLKPEDLKKVYDLVNKLGVEKTSF